MDNDILNTNLVDGDVVQQIRQHHELAQKKAQEAVDHAAEAGRLLTLAKAKMEHGQWLPWLKKNFQFTPRTAQRYIRAAAPRVLPVKRDRLSYSSPEREEVFRAHRAARTREQRRDEVCERAAYVLAGIADIQGQLRPEDLDMFRQLRSRIDECLKGTA